MKVVKMASLERQVVPMRDKKWGQKWNIGKEQKSHNDRNLKMFC